MKITEENISDIKKIINENNHMAEKCFNTYKNVNSDNFAFQVDVLNAHINVGAILNEAKLGYAQAMFEIGFMFENGIYFQRNIAVASSWYEKGAKKGNADCQLALFYMYRFGRGTEINLHKSVFWLKLSAENGSVDAMFLLGQMYIEGLAEEADNERALYWIERSAGAGSVDAMLFLGSLAEKGEISEADIELAYKWYSKAAGLHSSEAHIRLAQLVFREFYNNAKCMKKAVYYLNISVNDGNGEAMFLLGNYYKSLGGTFYKKAFDLLKKSADTYDNVLATLELAEMYESGKGVEPDAEKAIEYYEKVLNLI